jgi:hypothetical protein
VAKRLKTAEKKLGGNLQKKFVMKDFDGLFYGDCGRARSQEQFDSWAKEQGEAVLITVFSYVEEEENVE